jgi:hypothetical protein
VREEAKYPESRSSQAAIEGTHDHTVLETCIKTGNVPEYYIGTEFEDEDGKFILDSERSDRVRVAVDYVGGREALSERKVNAGGWLDRDDLQGTADIIMFHGEVLEVVDYKGGWTPVEAKDNPQMSIYAAGVLADMEDHEHIRYIRLTIVQPRMKELGQEPVSTWTMAKTELMGWVNEILGHAAKATDDPNAPLNPGEKQCKWCRAKGGCKALAEKALGEAQIMFKDIDIAQRAADKDPNELTDADLQQLIEAKPLIMQMIEGAEKEAMRRFQTGHNVPGLKVIRNPGRRKWALSDEEIADKLKRMRMPKDLIYKQTLVSPKQAKEAKWRMKVKGEEVETCLSERQIKRLDKEYIEMSQGSLKVVPESTSGAAVVMDAPTMFEDVKPIETEKPNETEKPQLPAWLA